MHFLECKCLNLESLKCGPGSLIDDMLVLVQVVAWFNYSNSEVNSLRPGYVCVRLLVHMAIIDTPDLW